MDVTFDPHLFTQIGLDSASLTMLGTVVHSFQDPGEYRCVVHEGPAVKATFIVRSDKASPHAQALVDLEALVSGSRHTDDCHCGCAGAARPGAAAAATFEVNPRGYVVFRVGRGRGQYYVHARRVDAPVEDKGYETRRLVEGDLFSAILLRPGAYEVTNSATGAKGQLVVTYPRAGERKYRPEGPVRVRCGPQAFEPARLTIGPGQGVIFEAYAPSRIEIALSKPDDGPTAPPSKRPPRRFANRLR
jgi:hypothetical protein